MIHYGVSGTTNASYYFSTLPDRQIIDPDELTVDVPFIYSIQGIWFAAVKRKNGKIGFYQIKMPVGPWYVRLWRAIRR